jgi:hypothetical protein
MSSACFDTEGSSSGRRLYVQVWQSVFSMHHFFCIFIVWLYVYEWLPWLRFFRAFSSVVRQMPGWCPQRQGTARTLPNFFFFSLCFVCVALCIFLCCSMYLFCIVPCDVCFVTFPVLFVCIYVLNNCHRVATQLQLNIYLTAYIYMQLYIYIYMKERYKGG